MTTTAERMLKPKDTTIFRTAFLYVGQGDATLHVIPNGQGGFLYALTDINRDAKCSGLDVVKLLEDLLPKVDGKPVLDLFINTHPHNDHLCGLDELQKRIAVREVWHTGFEPSNKHEGAYKHLTDLIKSVRKAHGDAAVFEYQGTRAERDLGLVAVNIVSPAEYVKDEIDELSGEERDSRIHEYCGVLRLGYGSPRKHVLMTGDSDKCAWKEHILGEDEYHADRVRAAALSASHHGSRSFFKTSEDDEEPYTQSMEIITPTWVIISSPSQDASPHGHPHDDAVVLYETHVKDGKAENVRVLGNRRECVIYDIYANGDHVMESDDGELVEAYGLDGDDDGGDGRAKKSFGPAIITRVDDSKPMGTQRPSYTA